MNGIKKVLTLGLSTLLISTGYVKVNALNNVNSIQGNNRYSTAGIIADKKDYDVAILVNLDKSLADGLSASGLAGAVDAPILLTQKDNIPIETMSRLDKVNKVYLIGNENVISKNIEVKLKEKNIEVIRIGGTDRIETSYKVAKEISSIKDIDKVIFTNGYSGEADAMSISPVASRDKSPIILTDGKNTLFDAKGVKSYVIGSKSVVSDEFVNKTKSIRIGGIDRFDTNKKVIEYFYKNPDTFYISDGYKLVDALTAAPLAQNSPIVLVSNTSDKSILKNSDTLTTVGEVDYKISKQCVDMILLNEKDNKGIKKAQNILNEMALQSTEKRIYEYILPQAIGIDEVNKNYYAFGMYNTDDPEYQLMGDWIIIVDKNTFEVYEYCVDGTMIKHEIK
ncbi:cell wall-binding repeat-containing protein [Romboutsia maritimum]|uniref:Cell wall-binding repeat-containing protein n=1 Tax=Romboutsia maritimum TaxID=2020948 RepID=A0A371IVT0_9FIRM|nr:cell wall-binding repeat-containing protein [Romboutsia maritimum]RDY24592.1 cell wall-binding repeat-containing protein [Romboutsia maritimum]